MRPRQQKRNNPKEPTNKQHKRKKERKKERKEERKKEKHSRDMALIRLFLLSMVLFLLPNKSPK
jgi:hypothetical protein